MRQVRLIRFGAPQQHEYLLNDSAQVVAWIRFADGSDAIYKVTVPEPAGLPVLAAALLLLPRRRRLGAAGVHGA